MHHSATNELSILLVLAFIIFISPYFSKISKIPIAPIEIILGILFGFFGFIPQSELFRIVAEVGFFYLMFLAGTEIDLKSFFKIEKSVIKLVLSYIAILYILAVLLSILISPAFLVVIVVPLMSVGILSTLFKEYGKNEIEMIDADVNIEIDTPYAKYSEETDYSIDIKQLEDDRNSSTGNV